MHKDVSKLINETVTQFFEGAPSKPVVKGNRAVSYDICPHCKTEIFERHEYTEDGGVTWRHSECKGLISRPSTPIDEIVDWLQPYVKEARENRGQIAIQTDNSDLPVGGEKKYNTQEPGGQMAAVNLNEVSTKNENSVLQVHTDNNFMDGAVTILNAGNKPVQVFVTEYSAMVDEVNSVKKYFIKIRHV